MRVLVGPDKLQVPGEILLRVVLRSDLAPVPETIEITVRDDVEFRKYWEEGQEIIAGRDDSVFRIVKSGLDDGAGLVQGPRRSSAIQVIGMLASCAPIASRMQRAVIREGATLGEIYRACGATARIDSDFVVQRFSCFVGMVPSYAVAVALQEEAAVLTHRSGKLQFRRLAELARQEPFAEIPDAAERTERSEFLERHAVPFGYSTDDDGNVVFGKKESARTSMYWPRSNSRVLNNLSVALVTRRIAESEFSPDILAGHRIRIGQENPVVVTAAHVWDTTPKGQEQYSKFWLGEVVR